MKSVVKNLSLQGLDDLYEEAMNEEIVQCPVISDKRDIVEIEINKLMAFENHPFEVNNDEKMHELAESIAEKGVVNPILVRPKGSGYEIISGHRRTFASKKAGLIRVPAIIKHLGDDEATILMVDSNIQREGQKPSERAKSLKMKYDCIKRQGKRTDLTLAHYEPKLSSEQIGEEEKLSAAHVKRYIRLNYLLPEILKLVDENKLGFVQAVDLSFLKENEQDWVLRIIQESGKKINTKQSALIKSKSQTGILTEDIVCEIIIGGKKEQRKVVLNEKELSEFFRENLDSEHIKEIILELLKNWKEGINNG